MAQVRRLRQWRRSIGSGETVASGSGAGQLAQVRRLRQWRRSIGSGETVVQAVEEVNLLR